MCGTSPKTLPGTLFRTLSGTLPKFFPELFQELFPELCLACRLRAKVNSFPLEQPAGGRARTRSHGASNRHDRLRTETANDDRE